MKVEGVGIRKRKENCIYEVGIDIEGVLKGRERNKKK